MADSRNRHDKRHMNWCIAVAYIFILYRYRRLQVIVLESHEGGVHARGKFMHHFLWRKG